MGQGANWTWSLVGRDAEFDAAQSGLHPGGGVLLTGPSGVGKTALARAVLEEIAAAGICEIQWLVAASTAASIPFGAFGPLVPDVGGDLASPPDAFGLLQSVRRAVLARAGEKHLVLAVEDAHRLDDASATLIFQLVSTGQATAVVTTRSAAAMPDGMRALWKKGLVERIDLQPLNREHTVILASHLLSGQLDGDLAEALWRMSSGNPLYLKELVRSGRAAGRVVAERGLWRVRGQLTVGPRLSELVQERLARLSRSELATLEVIAFADPVPLSVLTRLASSSSISALQRQHLVQVQSGQEEEMRPAHPVYGEVVRASLPAPRVLELRVDLANAYEAAGRLDNDMLRVVTWRLDAGGLEDPELLLAASRRAADHQDWGLCSRLAAAAVAAGKQRGAVVTLADALNHQGRHEEALAALGDWQGDADDDERARVAVLRAHVLYWGLGRTDEADETLALAEDLIADPSSRA
jgi:hypothetical protein